MNAIEKAARDMVTMMGGDPDSWIDMQYIADNTPDTFLMQMPAKATRVRLWVTAAPFVACVLNSIKEPSEGMTEAGLSSVHHGVSLVWRPMIEAALEGA